MTSHYTPEQHQQLLLMALESIKYGLSFNKRMTVNHHDTPPEFLQQRACFVTLKKNGLLRGCIGSLEATEPLINNVINNAYNSAFGDPRFPALEKHELIKLSIQVSLLSQSNTLDISDEDDLLKQLRPKIDGLILYDHQKNLKATFLPSVWQDLSEPAKFLNHLKKKAGLPEDYWSNHLAFERYTVESFEMIVESENALE